MPTQPSAEPDFRVNPLADDPLKEGFNEKGVLVDYDSVECIAKKITDPETNRSRYFIKTNNGGPDAGHFYNPRSIYGVASPSSRGRAGMSSYIWRPVNVDAFDSYLRFLATQNPMHYREAERNSCQS